MSQWKSDDSAANSVLWAVQQYKLPANTANQADFYGNTTADAFITGLTVGQFGADAAEVAGGAIPHTGWIVRTEGSGGRAGRVSYEVLVAGGITGDGDSVIPEWTLNITSQPDNVSANATADDTATFIVAAESVPSGATITYQWQIWGGASFANVADGGAYSNSATDTLYVLANTASNGEIYRAGVYASGAPTIYSANAVLTITT